MVRRSRTEIYFDVLEVIRRGEDKPTLIMYRSNLNWAVLNETLSVLVLNGFLAEEQTKNSKKYYITDKGISALSYHRKSLEGFVSAKYGL